MKRGVWTKTLTVALCIALIFPVIFGGCTEVHPLITAEIVLPDEGITYAELRIYRDGQEVLRVADFALGTKERFAALLFLKGFPHTVNAAAEWREEDDAHEIYVVLGIDNLLLLKGTVDPTQPIADQQIYKDAEMIKGQPEVLELNAAFEAAGLADTCPNSLWWLARSYNLLEPPFGDIIDHVYHGTIYDVPLVGLATNDTKREEVVKAIVSGTLFEIAAYSLFTGKTALIFGIAGVVVNAVACVYGGGGVPCESVPCHSPPGAVIYSPIPSPAEVKRIFDAEIGELNPDGSRETASWRIWPDGRINMK